MVFLDFIIDDIADIIILLIAAGLVGGGAAIYNQRGEDTGEAKDRTAGGAQPLGQPTFSGGAVARRSPSDISNRKLDLETLKGIAALRDGVPEGQPLPAGPVAASMREPPARPMPAPSHAVPNASGAKGGFGLLAVLLVASAGVLLATTATGRDLIGRLGDGVKDLLAGLGLKLDTFTLFGLLKGKAPAEPQEPQTDLVDCSVFAPKAAPPASTLMVQVFLHVPEHGERAAAQATLMDVTATLKGAQTLQTQIRRGQRVDIWLTANGIEIDEPAQWVTWRGEPVFAQFLVSLPGDCDGRSFHIAARIGVGGGIVGCIKFRIAADAKAVSPATEASGESALRYKQAFLSYASPDRAEVLKRAQVLGAAGIPYFQDVLSLDPGQRWEREIYKHIDGCDLFLLFWSQAAKDSEWVMKEAEYALARAELGEVPDIVPVIIQGPPAVLPPEKLKHLHFNDRINYLIAAS